MSLWEVILIGLERLQSKEQQIKTETSYCYTVQYSRDMNSDKFN